MNAIEQLTEAERVRLRELWGRQCGPCDGGLPMDCACPDDDPRPVIMHLLDALEAARKQAEAQGNKLADGLHKWRDEALAAEAENQRLREGIEALIPDLVDVVHGDFSHSAGLICDQCPGWPHTYCVPAEKLDALLSTSSVRGEGDG